MIVMLKNKTIAFPAIAEMAAIGDGEPAYGCRFAIDPADPQVAEIEAAMLSVAKGKWKDEGAAVLTFLQSERKTAFLREPARNKKTGKVYDGFEGCFTLGARNAKTQPTVFDLYGNPVTDKRAIEQLIYSGAKVNAKVEFWPQDNQFGRRVNCSLLGVMFAGEGERFGGGSAPAKADDFADMAQTPQYPDDASDLV